ncbi:MAG TPA: 2-dehydro-3-deoxy-6-phosphogalactonate aldolase [Azospirillaceae bacterium]|nr:2-dehydro-3-deoxy-6-phosphogalactonate aldolase [Azospirillaceae bacterium]
MTSLENALAELPLFAILRGLVPEEADAVGDALFEAGIRAVEVPLNSPRPLDSIARLAARFEGRMVVGAGTVLTTEEARAVAAAGGRFAVAPNTDADVIAAALAAGIVPVPGVATATEALVAIKAGAVHLKLFPAGTYGPGHVKALLPVLPAAVRIYAVGGVGPAAMGEWAAAGAAGAGLGGELFKPGMSAADVGARARTAAGAARAAWR